MLKLLLSFPSYELFLYFYFKCFIIFDIIYFLADGSAEVLVPSNTVVGCVYGATNVYANQYVQRFTDYKFSATNELSNFYIRLNLTWDGGKFRAIDLYARQDTPARYLSTPSSILNILFLNKLQSNILNTKENSKLLLQ